MALIVEDGSIVASANSFADVDTIRAYAEARGVDLDADDEVVEAQAISAMDYFLLYLSRWKGWEVSPGVQTLAWPREGVRLTGYSDYLATDAMPVQLAQAQAQLVMAIASGIVSLIPNREVGLPIIKEKVGPLETQYATPVQTGAFDWSSVKLPVVDLLLAPLLEVGFGVRVRRV